MKLTTGSSTGAYYERANRCRELAEQTSSVEDRDILLKIADTWDWIARDLDAPNEDMDKTSPGGERSKPNA
jgi:hypothetical protein